MEAAVAEHAAQTAQMATQLAAALKDKEAAASELAVAARAVEEARVQAGKASEEAAAERTEAQHVADKIREQAAAQTTGITPLSSHPTSLSLLSPLTTALYDCSQDTSSHSSHHPLSPTA
jgi:hypothetical protein